MKYTVATKKGLWDIVRECMTEQEELKEQTDREKLIEEQDNILKQAYGKSWFVEPFYMIRHKSDWIKEEYAVFWDIDDAINCLAIKDGADLIRFENGNLGYVAYYNGMKDIIEFVARFKDIEDFILDKGGNDVDVENFTDGLEEIVLHSFEEIKEHIDNYS